MIEKYYWSALIAAVIAFILVVVFTFLVFFTNFTPLWMVWTAGGFALYAVVGAFFQGFDRE